MNARKWQNNVKSNLNTFLYNCKLQVIMQTPYESIFHYIKLPFACPTISS